MGDNAREEAPIGLALRWRVEIGAGSTLPQGAYSMIELDARTCVLERSGSPSFEILAADVVLYEKAGILHVIGPQATNDNSNAAG
jgi:hypothetical protein